MNLRVFCGASLTLFIFISDLAAAPQRMALGMALGTALGTAQLPVGFATADADSDGSITLLELTVYLSERLKHLDVPFEKVFEGIDTNSALIGTKPWMEISADFAPGGSGCGVFNDNHELVGLVSMIMMGDGPTMASQDLSLPPPEDESADGAEAFAPDGAMVVVKLAVPLTAIRELCE